MKTKLTILFFLLISIVYFTLNLEKSRVIDTFLERKTQKFELVYQNIYKTKEELADFIYRKIIVSKQFQDIYTKISTASVNEKNILREKLYQFIKSDFEQFSINKKDTIHFHLQNNESFLRMHNPKKHGDSLTNSREMVVCVNECLKKVHGFEQGKILSAYRFIYPIIINKEHFGSMEIAFSIQSITSQIIASHNVLTNLFIKNDILTQKLKIKSLDNFTQSDYDGYCYDNNFLKILQKYGKIHIEKSHLPKELNKKIIKTATKGKNKTIYCDGFESTITILPIWNNVSKKLEAFLKIQEPTTYIKTINFVFNIVFLIVSIIIFLILFYIYNQNRFSQKVQTEKQLVQNILNSLSNITFVTDFKTLEYANLPFLSFFGMKSLEEFHKKFNFVHEIFLEDKEYLYKKSTINIKEFANLIITTDETRRKVKIYNNQYEMHSFVVNISSVKYNKNNSYLLSLTDITKEEVLKKEIEKKAYYDQLTNIYNRNKFNELFEIEFNNVKRYDSKFSLAIIDIDKFKNFNDTYGHLLGDETLVLLANEIQKNIRTTDIFARWGGEEFIILFSNTGLEDAYLVCEKLRQKVEQLNQNKIVNKVTISIGLAQYKKQDNMRTLFTRADQLLYDAKANGRNQVEKEQVL